MNENDNNNNPTPMIKGYSLIKDEKIANIDATKHDLFTWGEVAATPNVISSQKYHIPSTPSRDKIALNLANKYKEKDRKKEPNKTQLFATNSRNIELTPSGIKLLSTIKSKIN